MRLNIGGAVDAPAAAAPVPVTSQAMGIQASGQFSQGASGSVSASGLDGNPVMWFVILGVAAFIVLHTL